MGRVVACTDARMMPVAIAISTVNANVAAAASAPAAAPAATLQISDLQPGTVITALVLAVLDNGAVQLAVGNALLAATTQVPLTPGATVQLAVQTTDNGATLRLIDQTLAPNVPSSAVVAVAQPVPGAPAAPTTASEHLGPAAASPVVPPGGVTTATGSNAVAATAAPPSLPAPVAAADPAVALTVAVRSAAVTQNSLAPLFAEATAALGLPALPGPLRQQLTQLMALRPELGTLSAADVRQAFAHSGLFLEAQLADGTGAAGAILGSTVANAATGKGAGVGTPAQSGAATFAAAPTGAAALDLAMSGGLPASDLKAALIVLRQVLSTVIADSMGAAPVPDAAGAETGLAGEAAARPQGGVPPPPPFRGALPSAQPSASPTITAATPPQDAAKVLMSATDAALSRQTLLQAASLPDQAAGGLGSSSPRLDDGGPRWNFEVPFATPQGTNIAQFEISRDGRSSQPADALKAVWRARFSIDIEPLGPVHAQVSLSGARTNVMLWAERPEGAARLRDGAATLTDALRGAELDAGEPVVRDGVPKRSGAPMPAGHFLDRAS